MTETTTGPSSNEPWQHLEQVKKNAEKAVKKNAEKTMLLFDSLPPSLRALLRECEVPDNTIHQLLYHLKYGPVTVQFKNGDRVEKWEIRP